MTWADAVAWADGLSFFDTVRGVTWDDWRLPLTSQPDPSCSTQSLDVPPQGLGVNCTGSEMGYLFNVEGIVASSPGLFTNVQQSLSYWSGSEYAPFPSLAWNFGFGSGFQLADARNIVLFAWAVRPGDVAAQSVAEPGTAISLGAALGLLWLRRHAQVTPTDSGPACRQRVAEGAHTGRTPGRDELGAVVVYTACARRTVECTEGMAHGEQRQPSRHRFLDDAVRWCAGCTPGLRVADAAFLDRDPDPVATDVRFCLAGHRRRCTGYDETIRAEIRAVTQMSGA